jgi:hypothetical protein
MLTLLSDTICLPMENILLRAATRTFRPGNGCLPVSRTCRQQEFDAYHEFENWNESLRESESSITICVRSMEQLGKDIVELVRFIFKGFKLVVET